VEFDEIIGASKALIAPPTWVGPEPDTEYVWFEAPLEISGIVQPGLFLFGGAYKRRPNSAASFELRQRRPPARRYSEIERVDWRPLDGGHTIPMRKKIPYGAGKRIEGTHWYLFEYNVLSNGTLLERLPVAIETPYEIKSFEELVAFWERTTRITNMSLVSAPPWEYVLI
jgi:hypothetical protein